MKKLIHEYRFFIIGLLLFYIFIISSLFINVKKDLTAPASITSVSESIHIGDSDERNIFSVNTVAVYSYENINLLSYLLGLTNPYATIDNTNEYSINDLNSVYRSGKIQKDISVYNSIIAGYKQAGYSNIVNENSFRGYIIHSITKLTPSELQIGDVIVAFNGTRFTEAKTYNEFSYEFSKLNYDESSTYQMTVIRNNEELEFKLKPSVYVKDGQKYVTFGISTYCYLLPSQNLGEDCPNYIITEADSLGPSGGLMQSLYVYEALTNFKLTRGKKIVGTGTVDAFGKAGAIGGIYQKVITANKSGADIFFVPVSSLEETVYSQEDNYKEALESYQNLGKTEMKLVPVSSLEDIINYLKGE